ncbi:MAG: hypothetical protein KF891_07110 [Rhizobacter sp.]|nr:hypothetical protein [Rhizobacter sp.]
MAFFKIAGARADVPAPARPSTPSAEPRRKAPVRGRESRAASPALAMAELDESHFAKF